MNISPRGLLAQKEIEGRVRIHRPVAEVFEFYRDFTNLPLFLGDVMTVEPTGDKTSLWTIQGPAQMRIRWEVEVIELEPNSLIRYRTTSFHRLVTTWNIYFAVADSGPDAPDSTDVREVMELPLGNVTMPMLALLGKPPADEIAANLRRFKQLMETGRVTDMSHAVSGKFEDHRTP